jgi:hypothetical protein
MVVKGMWSQKQDDMFPNPQGPGAPGGDRTHRNGLHVLIHS